MIKGVPIDVIYKEIGLGAGDSEKVSVPDGSPFYRYAQLLVSSAGCNSIVFGTFNVGFVSVLTRVAPSEVGPPSSADAMVLGEKLSAILIGCEAVGSDDYFGALYAGAGILKNPIVSVTRASGIEAYPGKSD